MIKNKQKQKSASITQLESDRYFVALVIKASSRLESKMQEISRANTGLLIDYYLDFWQGDVTNDPSCLLKDGTWRALCNSH